MVMVKLKIKIPPVLLGTIFIFSSKAEIRNSNRCEERVEQWSNIPPVSALELGKSLFSKFLVW